MKHQLRLVWSCSVLLVRSKNGSVCIRIILSGGEDEVTVVLFCQGPCAVVKKKRLLFFEYHQVNAGLQ